MKAYSVFCLCFLFFFFFFVTFVPANIKFMDICFLFVSSYIVYE
jgi:hypothetical protein